MISLNFVAREDLKENMPHISWFIISKPTIDMILSEMSNHPFCVSYFNALVMESKQILCRIFFALFLPEDCWLEAVKMNCFFNIIFVPDVCPLSCKLTRYYLAYIQRQLLNVIEIRLIDNIVYRVCYFSLLSKCLFLMLSCCHGLYFI